jgi:glucokinase-like ROK family protein
MNTQPPILSSNEAKVLEIVRKSGAVSRADLAEIIGYSRASMTSLINNLTEQGILTEVGDGLSSGGRKPRMLHFNRQYGYVVGIDMGATSLDIALADFGAYIIERHSQPINLREHPDVILAHVRQIILEMLLKRQISPEKVFGIGMGVPGPVEFSTGLLIAPPLMPGWDSYPIRSVLRETFPNARVAVDNDVNVMAIGEKRAGLGNREDNFFVVKIGTGIGCGIMVDGHLYRGSSGCAGDIGHICVDRNGPVCHCGNIGCLEAMAAGPAIALRGLEAAKRGQSEILANILAHNGKITTEDVGSAVADRTANEIIADSGRLIGEALASLVNFFNPGLIVIGGGVSNIGDRLLASIRRTVLMRSLPLSTRHLKIDISEMGSDMGVTGAIALALEYIFDQKEVMRAREYPYHT